MTLSWRDEHVNDDDWKDSVKKITDPTEMLECLTNNQDYLGGDPYYKDLANVLWYQADVVLALENMKCHAQSKEPDVDADADTGAKDLEDATNPTS